MTESALLQFFSWEHLRPELQSVSRPFAELARHLNDSLPNNPEKTVALRKLLEAKDCAVRAVLFKAPASSPAAPSASPRTIQF